MQVYGRGFYQRPGFKTGLFYLCACVTEDVGVGGWLVGWGGDFIGCVCIRARARARVRVFPSSPIRGMT